MPTFRKKVANFLRQFTSHSESKCNSTSSTDETDRSARAPPLTLTRKFLNGDITRKNQPTILSAKSCYDLPVKNVSQLSKTVAAAYSGPEGGLIQVKHKLKPFELSEPDVDFIDEDLVESVLQVTKEEVAGTTALDRKDSGFSEAEMLTGVTNWDNPTDTAYGIANSLYERHPTTGQQAGDPVADTFAVCMRENSGVLVLADGVNWGEKSSLASRCAVRGCMDYLNRSLYQEGSKRIQTTLDIYVCLLRSFYAAHTLILQEEGQLTTLCAAVICPLRHSSKFLVCTCNVGDSLAYVYSPVHGVREVTQGSHDIHSMRDMRDALGALGPVDGHNPELSNLTVAMTLVDQGDIVFLSSDGISDNFDPVVAGFGAASKSSSLPEVTAVQRHHLALLQMEELLENCSSARQLCERLVDYCLDHTEAKRKVLQDPSLYEDDSFSQEEQRLRRRKVGSKLAATSGKLDHASVVAYKVVPFKGTPRRRRPPRTLKHSKVSPAVHHIESSI